jgi:hypothetical protein
MNAPDFHPGPVRSTCTPYLGGRLAHHDGALEGQVGRLQVPAGQRAAHSARRTRPQNKACHILLATLQDGAKPKKRGFKMRLMTWRALSISPYPGGRRGMAGHIRIRTAARARGRAAKQVGAVPRGRGLMRTSTRPTLNSLNILLIRRMSV